MPRRIEKWSLTNLQHRLMKTCERLVKHARYYWLLLVEWHLNHKLFAFERLHRFPVFHRNPLAWGGDRVL